MSGVTEFVVVMVLDMGDVSVVCFRFLSGVARSRVVVVGSSESWR